MKKVVLLLVLAISFVLISAPALVSAEEDDVLDDVGLVTDKDDIVDILNGIKTWVSALVAVLGVIMILWGAIVYMTAGGDEEKVGKAKKTIVYGIIGIAIALIAFGIFALVEDFLTTTI